jgi:hypothetical protein
MINAGHPFNIDRTSQRGFPPGNTSSLLDVTTVYTRETTSPACVAAWGHLGTFSTDIPGRQRQRTHPAVQERETGQGPLRGFAGWVLGLIGQCMHGMMIGPDQND